MEEEINIKTSWIFTPERGTYSLALRDSRTVALAVSSSSAHPLASSEEEFGGFAYLLTRVDGRITSWRYDSPQGFNCAAFDPVDERVIFGNDDGNVYIFDLDGTLITTIKFGTPVYSCAFSPHGNRVAIATEGEGGGKVSILDKNFEHLWEFLTDDNVWGLSWHVDEEMLAVASHDGNVYILKKPTAIWKEEVAEAVNKVKWCGNKLAVATFKPGKVLLYDTKDPRNPTLLWEIEEGLNNVWGLSFNDDCTLLAYGDASNGKFGLIGIDGNEIISQKYKEGIQSLDWKGAKIALATERLKVLSVLKCGPISSYITKLELVTTLSEKWDRDEVELSSLLHTILGRPEWLYVNGKLLKVSVVEGNHLYVKSPMEGEVELKTPRGI
ncbi:hypothetical protein IPA_05475 [Ignicoccus pacificus DSM 13166]|uniref:Anaphase-promoting complex subunit 4-like WD40 domain-containing protein n=1 Tax=Ignicoccus pacificus DSM 13166 TaxID=940294 RepID=A0A977KBC6_9CREN|nr:hypothetical protein IPA_05475 [Ignicoccus pacificus DSM 13166]